jgi:hypothetical protein
LAAGRALAFAAEAGLAGAAVFAALVACGALEAGFTAFFAAGLATGSSTISW